MRGRRLYPGDNKSRFYTRVKIEGRGEAVDDCLSRPCVAFADERMIAAGPLSQVALVARERAVDATAGPVLVFDDASGRVIDLDLRGSAEEVLARLARGPGTGGEGAEAAAPGPRRRGRPRLGVVAREVTLLPRHWDWLARQPGGASQALRRMVEDAVRRDGSASDIRDACEAAHRFMSAMAGDLPNFEEASRALFASDPDRFAAMLERWPPDIARHATRLATRAFACGDAAGR